MLTDNDIQEVPTFLLRDQAGKLLVNLLRENSTYYALFAKVLMGQNQYFSELLFTIERGKSSDLHIRQRASIITIMESLSIDYHHAWGIYPHVKENLPNLTLEEALQIVLRNYKKILNNEVHTPPILVKIDEFGRARIIEGLHRSIISILQNSPTITSIIVTRDNSWTAFVNMIANHSLKMYGDPNLIYHHINHPDFATKKVIREERSGAFLDLVERSDISSVIDFGAFYGEMSHLFARNGKNVTAIEYDKEFAFVIEKLNKTYELNVNVINTEVTNFLENFEGKADLGIALSIAYHLRRRDIENFDYFIRKLKEICNFILIDSENKTGILSDKILIDQFAGWNHQLIHEGSDMRNIYLFSQIQ